MSDIYVYPRPDSRFYWYKFTFNGKLIQKSSKVRDKSEATKIARAAWTQYARGEVGIADRPIVPRKTLSDLLDGLITHLKENGIVERTQYNWAELVRKDLGNKDTENLSKADMVQYKASLKAPRKVGNLRFPQRGKRRLGSGCLADDTIRNRFSTIAAAYNVENEWRKSQKPPLPLLTCPGFPKLEKKKIRTNFVERVEFDVFYSLLPEYLKDYALFLFVVGWRREAVANLKWGEDLTGNLRDGTAVIHLSIENSKTKTAYSVPVAGELVELMQRRAEARLVTDNLHGRGSYHFPHMVGQMSEFIFHRAGSKIKYLEDVWQKAANRAGCPSLTRHDLRRSARRSFRKAGVHDDVTNSIIGWENKGESMATHYDPISDEDKREALELVWAYHKKQQAKVTQFQNVARNVSTG